MKYKEIIITLLLIWFGFYIADRYQDYNKNKVFTLDDNVIHSEACSCGDDEDVLKYQFELYQLNRSESLLIDFIYKYEAKKENKYSTDKIDDKNFLILTKDYINNYKNTKDYEEKLKLFDYIYKNFYPSKYEDFKKAIK